MKIFRFIKQALQPATQKADMREAIQVQGQTIGLTKTLIPKQAIQVTSMLQKNGFEAYLVGGCVRDLLLQRVPKDFDVATDAKPEQIKKLFRSCYLVGRRFRIAHVRMGRDVYEVSTFRGSGDIKAKGKANTREHSEHGMVLDDNVYGSLQEDAFRRDFTVNALYYNPKNDTVIDYTGGIADLKAKRICMIGDPLTRYREDPVRILRALRFSAKLDLAIDEATLAPIDECKELLANIAPARLFLEIEKLLRCGYSADFYEFLKQHDIFQLLFPDVYHFHCSDDSGEADLLLQHLLQNTDVRVRAGKSTTPAFFLAGLLWPLQQTLMLEYSKEHPNAIASDMAADAVFAGQLKTMSIPKRFSSRSKEIWSMQFPLINRRGNSPLRMVEHPRFRAAYDFLLLRSQVNASLVDVANWWTCFQEMNEDERRAALKELHSHVKKPRKKRKKVDHTKKSADDNPAK